RPHWTVGLNLVPHGINALLAAKVAGGRSLFHMIGGPREILGGGWCSDNAVLGRLPRPVPALERLLVRLVRACDFVAVMGTEARRLLIERGMAADRVVPIPASVDERRFHPRAADGQDYDLVTVSQLIPRKRLDDFVRAVARLRQTRPRLRAAIVGRGPVEADLRTLAERLGVGDAIDFLGFRGDVEELYARSRVFVLTSRSEGLSIAIAEAMASGLPVVVTDVGEVRDLVRDSENGHLFAVGDVDALVRLAAGLLDDPGRCSSLGRRAAADARAVCGPERVRALYRGLLAGRP
ncbi:MAG: glycosyltransferase, partial [Actinobacteria bacterium]|nr:glycosyltransferase [Actinomycetota bacterium]